jgi:hypothetical protein
MKYMHLMLTSVALMTAMAEAEVVFNAASTNTTLVGNSVSVSGDGATVTGSPGSLVFTNPNGANNTSGFTSTGDIDTLRGKALKDTDIVVISATITSLTGDLTSNGLEFGMSPNATDFRPAARLMVKYVTSGTVSVGGLATATADFTIALASLKDGFGVKLTVNKEGWTFEFTDVVLLSGTSATISGSFSGTEFVDNFGGGHFYLTGQKDASPDMVINFSEASIDAKAFKDLSLMFITSP